MCLQKKRGYKSGKLGGIKRVQFEWKVKSGKWKVKSGKWKVKSGK